MSTEESGQLTLREQIEQWESLLAHPAWKWLEGTLKEQSDTRLQRVMLTPLTDMGSTLEQEYSKGEFQAFTLVPQLPGLAIEQLQAEIKALNQGDE